MYRPGIREVKLLVIGAGGREHALAWKLAASRRVTDVLVAPGNAGTAREDGCRNVDVSATDIDGLLALARRERVDLTVVGPETPLVAGLVDRFRAEGLRIFGPTAAGARLEGSKAFAKEFLARHGIPTAHYAVFEDLDAALAYVQDKDAPIVVKADGLAAGKGVVVATTLAEAEAAVRDMLAGNVFGAAGSRVVIEEFLDGEEASFISIVDGRIALPMATSQDHKRVGDGDTGPNTGGMGAYSPAPVVTPDVQARVMREIVEPTVRGMAADGTPFTGFLYAGLMIDKAGAPKVIEFNVRFGDPETQPVMLRLRSDLLDLIEAAVDGTLADDGRGRLSRHPAHRRRDQRLGRAPRRRQQGVPRRHPHRRRACRDRRRSRALRVRARRHRGRGPAARLRGSGGDLVAGGVPPARHRLAGDRADALRALIGVAMRRLKATHRIRMRKPLGEAASADPMAM
jgi:phosphoribosylamine--glycine ligase